MRSSIRKNFTLIFISLVAVLLLIMNLVHSIFLQKYYEKEKIAQMIEAYEAIDSAVYDAVAEGKTLLEIMNDEFDKNAEDSRYTSVFRTLSDRYGIDAVLMDDEGRKAGTSRESQWNGAKLKAYYAFRDVYGYDEKMYYPLWRGKNENNGSDLKRDSIKVISTTDNYTLQSFFDFRSKTNYIECWGTFSDDKTMFLLSMPLVSIEESAQISRTFLNAVTLLILVIGTAAVYLTTGMITKPINDLAGIAERMSHLDFSARYSGNSRNEIGVLGQSMNVMSERLEASILELKEANQRLREDNDLKTRIDDMRKEFIADVSHELKTPISIIEGYAEGLNEGLADSPEDRAYYCGVIIDEAAKMNRLVKQLTTLMSYEMDSNSDECIDFDASELVKSVVQSQSIKLNEAGAVTELKVEDGVIIRGDEFKIEEAFTNYLNNAVNHLDGKKRITVSLERRNGSAVFEVYNDGEPIPEESLNRIWEKFYKVDKSRSRKYGGSGIGLSIVKAIVESHGGSCSVENRENGVAFLFSIPLHNENYLPEEPAVQDD